MCTARCLADSAIEVDSVTDAVYGIGASSPSRDADLPGVELVTSTVCFLKRRLMGPLWLRKFDCLVFCLVR